MYDLSYAFEFHGLKKIYSCKKLLKSDVIKYFCVKHPRKRKNSVDANTKSMSVADFKR